MSVKCLIFYFLVLFDKMIVMVILKERLLIIILFLGFYLYFLGKREDIGNEGLLVDLYYIKCYNDVVLCNLKKDVDEISLIFYGSFGFLIFVVFDVGSSGFILLWFMLFLYCIWL